MESGLSKNKLQAIINRLVVKRVRVCQTLHSCILCPDGIKAGERYFDGGVRFRAHTRCVKERRVRD